MKGVMRFGNTGKLSPRYIGPYKISKRTGNIAYELELPPELAAVHPVIHISLLKKFMGDPSLIIPTKNIGIKYILSYEEIQVEILDHQKGPTPSSASAPAPRNKCEYNSQNSQNFRARPAHSQGSKAQGGTKTPACGQAEKETIFMLSLVAESKRIRQMLSLGVMRFGKKGKLSPRYIEPYRISKRIGNVAYELELPQKLVAVHPVFHKLKKCIGDPSLIIPTENIWIKDSLSYEEISVQILDRQVRKLRTKEVASAKVLWRNQFIEEATWEAEEDMKKIYPHLFESGENADQGTNSLLSTL
ncbi:hypothetical protein MTR67_012234 [Solanum verrucosum]|uniref:Chromo domain-containing protein n=1 Tax=Solanum verrucosum TaxID=315347 RepID=A0AAF0THB7_SOLVR|nr:hypothetical protein MTR67_012234 [Solanum verrucosum]